MTPQHQFNLPNLIQTLKKQGVPSEKVMDMLDELTPVMNATNKQELDFYKAHNTALTQALRVYVDGIRAATGQQRAIIAAEIGRASCRERV